jgi:hypothetical protein
MFGSLSPQIVCVRATEGAIKIDNPEKLVTYGTQDEEKENRAQHNMCWTPLYASKHK